MMVCDICFTPDPIASGSPTITFREPGKQAGSQYLFSGTGAALGAMHHVDLCATCLELLRLRAWDKIAERAQEVLMLRLGVDPTQSHDTSRHNPYCNPDCPDYKKPRVD